MKKTFNEVMEADIMVGGLYKKNPDLRDTKFGYAWKRFYEKNIAPTLKEYRAEIEDAHITHALEDKETGKILTDKENSRGYSYSKDGLKTVIKAEKEISEKYDGKEIEITPFISTYVPEGLTEEQTEMLTGSVL